MKLAELHEHKRKHVDAGAKEVPALEYEKEEFAKHVRELYQEVKPRPDDEKAAAQWDLEVSALANADNVNIGGVAIRRI